MPKPIELEEETVTSTLKLVELPESDAYRISVVTEEGGEGPEEVEHILITVEEIDALRSLLNRLAIRKVGS